MAMGRRAEQRQAQEEFWIAHTQWPRTVAHPFYQRLNQLLEERGFDEFVEGQCERFYAEAMGRPSLTPGRYFRLLLIGYFEGIEGERGIAWRAADSLALRQFLELGLTAARSLHDLAHAAADRGGNASSGIPGGAGVTGGERAAEGEDGGHRWHDAGSERSHALDCATGYGRGLRGVSAATGRGIGDRNADTGAVGEAGPQAGEEGIERRLGESA